ncbi:hypothetical protein Bpfe_002636 [Biomphalaria pfeifferi]|uniref:Uncharacterized protein n=1 Tax=Biomphalaria pfeifferi TaxID=112525 RepID=A0AAD8C7K4_BIOPF|nr:hypothetical protein Bpfe_002636 [Biomphalaria pfeifferi]
MQMQRVTTKPAAAENNYGRKKKINKNTKLKSYQLTGVHLCAVEFPMKSYSRNKSMPLSNSPHNVFIFSSITVVGFKQRPEMISVQTKWPLCTEGIANRFDIVHRVRGVSYRFYQWHIADTFYLGLADAKGSRQVKNHSRSLSL